MIDPIQLSKAPLSVQSGVRRFGVGRGVRTAIVIKRKEDGSEILTEKT
mgnify:CR=1 FL=1